MIYANLKSDVLTSDDIKRGSFDVTIPIIYLGDITSQLVRLIIKN